MTLTIMLAVHCKKSEPADLKPALVEYVRESYGQQVGCAAASGTDTSWVMGVHMPPGWWLGDALSCHATRHCNRWLPHLLSRWATTPATFAPPFAALPTCRPPRMPRTTWRR